MKRRRALWWLQPAVALGCVVPGVALAAKAATGRLGANPIATALNQLGLLALVLLVASLACTPIKILSGWKWPLRIRKTLGLAGFWAAAVHASTYLVVDQQLAWGVLLDDVLKRPFIMVGALAFLLLIPVAATSTKKALQSMGPKRWRRLHRLVYVIAPLGALHFMLRVKKDVTEPAIYGVLIIVLLAIRLRSARARAR